MRRHLLSILACPACGGDLSLETRDAGDAVWCGLLRCMGCRLGFPVQEGVPRLCLGTQHRGTQQGFEEQWKLRLEGRFESGSLLYGNDYPALVRWLVAGCLGGAAPGGWILDAGCGSGEKAMSTARQFPQARVVGLDLSSTVEISARRAHDVPNVEFVQADVLRPPIRRGAVDGLISWGVLHHTVDTARAFATLAPLVRPGGRAVIWLYPHPDEDPVWAWYYRIRDVHFLGRGHRLSPRLRLWLARLYCAAFAPLLLHHYQKRIVPKVRGLPYVNLGSLGLRQSYQAAVFLLYDALTPEFQFRHHSREVESWFDAAGFGPVSVDGQGHFWAEKPASPPAGDVGRA